MVPEASCFLVLAAVWGLRIETRNGRDLPFPYFERVTIVE